MFAWLGKIFAAPKPSAPQQVPMRGRFDSAQTTSENYRLWTMTDLLSAKSANSFAVRNVLRMRSRYEIANNSYARGMTLTMANDLIGTGPRLQVRTPDQVANRQIEAAWQEWATAADLPEKLATMKLSKIQDGEAFALFVNNPALDTSVQLDIQLIEADQVRTIDPGYIGNKWVDGVVLDRLGNASDYHVMDQHPGDLFFKNFDPSAYRVIPARKMIHWFRKDRPGAVRGIPEITASLELFGMHRRFVKAVLSGAEIAAAFSAVLESDYPPNTDADTVPSVGTSMDIERGQLVVTPYGTKLNQLRSENPSTTFEMFERLLLRQICRCLNIPLNIALGDSSGYNYSSGRLDHLGYWKELRIERSRCVHRVVDRIFSYWLDEAVMIPGLLPRNLPIASLPHRWFWDGQQSIDPLKDAKADETLLANNMTTLTEILAERGEDLDEFLEVRAKELRKMEALKIPVTMAQYVDPNSIDPASTDPNFQEAA